MKILFAISLLVVSFFSHASEPEMPVYSKFGVCVEAGAVASYTYNLKVEKKKLQYPKTDDVIMAVFYKQAADYGYRKATSEYDAAYTAHVQCLRSNLWSSL